MTQELENLIKLQDIDLKIIEQELAKEQYPTNVETLTKRMTSARQAKSAAAAKFEQLTGGMEDADSQIIKLQESLSKSQERLNSIRTNREYDAVHAEIETQKTMLEAAETKKKNLEANIETHKTTLSAMEEECDRIDTELQPEIDALNAKIDAIDSTIAEISKEREFVAPNLTQHTRRAYDSIRKKRNNGKAISIVGESKTCEICSMILRPQLYVELCRGQDFILCENCGSMLIWAG